MLLARVAAGVAIVLGLVVLVGWWSANLALTSLVPGAPSTAANTALKIVLCGISLALSTWRSAAWRWRLAGIASAAGAWVIAVFTIVEHALGVSSELDHALIGGADAELAPIHGKPSLQTAICFFFIAAALVLTHARRGPTRAPEILALVAASLAMIACFGFLFDVPALYGVEVHVPYGVEAHVPILGMALPTAASALLLAIGVLAARPEVGLMSIVTSEAAGGTTARRLFAVLVALLPVAIAMELLALAGWLPGHLADALVAFIGVVFGVAAVLRTAHGLNVKSTQLGAALRDATRWKQVFDYASWGAAVRSTDGTIVAANRAFHRMHGYGPGQLVGRAARQLFAAGARGNVEARLQSIGPGEQVTVESEQVRADGAVFPALVDATAVTDDTGELRYRAMFVRDVTELHRAEQARARLAALVDSSDDAIVGVALDGIIFAWSSGAERTYGYRPDEIIGRPVSVLVPNDRADEAQRLMDRIRRGEHVPSYETTRLRSDGTTFPVSLTVSPIIDASGRVIGASGIARDISGRVAMEEALRRSEEQYRALVEQASDGWLVADLSGRILDVNGAAARMLGYAREELIGTMGADLLLRPEELERFWALRDRLRQGGVEVGEWELRRKDGTFVPIEASTKILPDGRWQALVRDITRRKRAEAALAEAHRTELHLRCELERVLAASGAVSDALTGVPEGSLQLALEAVAKQAQLLTNAEYAAAGIGGDEDRPFEAWVYAGMTREQEAAIGRWPRPIGTFAVSARDGDIVRVPDVARHPRFRGLPRGHPPITSFLGIPIRFRGKPVGNLYLANKRGAEGFDEVDERVVQTLAARTAAAIEIAQLFEREGLQRAWLQTIVEQLPEAVVIADEHGRVVQQNEAAVRLASRGGEGDGGRVHYELRSAAGAELDPEDHPLHKALARGEETSCEELCLVKPEGELLAVLVSAKPIRTGSGPAGAIMVFQDISEQKEMQRLRDEWSSVVAHDLRQPVSVVAMSAALLQMHAEELPELWQKVVERIGSASQRLERMIGDLLDVSRIDARRLSLERRVLDLGGLVERVVEDLREQLPDARVRAAVEPGVIASVDPDRMQQVLANLLSNAAKYGEQGTEILVEVRRDGDRARVSVTNRGAGIAKEDLPHLFARFSRTREARSSGVPGIGLGLYICKGVIESHGGRIWAESTPGRTTTFHFTVPATARATLHAGPP